MRETIFSPCRTYRYVLWRHWDMFADGYLMVIGLNPSTADETRDDPTIRRCINFAKQWGYGALCMTNLFAYRSTDPQRLAHVEDPVGPENDQHLSSVGADAGIVLAAWGTQGAYRDREREVGTFLYATRDVMCLGTNKDDSPKHPLYVPKTTEPRRYYGRTME